MRKLAPRERRILQVTLVIFGLYLGDRLIWSPCVDLWENRALTVESKREQLVHDRQLLADRKQIQRDYAALVRRGSEGGHGEGMTGMLNELESLARASGVQLRDVKPQSSASRSGAAPTVVITVEAGWDAISSFLYNVQGSPQLLQIEKASLRRLGEDNGRISAQFRIAPDDPA